MSKVYQIITDRIVGLLEAGTVPWRRAWGGKWAHPRNAISGKPYRGVNVFLLGCQDYASPHWLTFKQAQTLGGNVKKGEKGTPIVFWKQWEREDDHGAVEKLPVLRYYTGFHVSQCEGLDAKRLPPEPEQPEFEFSPVERCERIVAGYRGGPEIKHDFDSAFYRPTPDLVGLPPRTRFETPAGYYATLFHELAHSTGHRRRLNRAAIAEGTHAFGSQTYGKEELVAEMGAAFLCGHTGIENATIDNSAAYLAGWCQAIKRDVKLVVQAAAAAQKAVDHILGVTWEDAK